MKLIPRFLRRLLRRKTGIKLPRRDEPLRVLITTYTLARRSGGEMHVYDLAVSLLKRGHLPVVYSTELGPIAAELQTASVPVISDYRQLGALPHVIHSNHPAETLSAFLHFPNTPLIHTCHAFVGDEAKPLQLSRIMRYVAVDDTVLDRVVAREGIDPARTQVILNWVDTERFVPGPRLPERPRRVLLFGNAVGPQGAWQRPVVDFCRQQAWRVERVGDGTRQIAEHPEELLPRYDLVFAKAKSALEAMACARAVILAGPGGLGPMVTCENFSALQRINFGLRATQQEFTPENLAAATASYSPEESRAVSRLVRRRSDISARVDEWIALYRTVCEEFADRPPTDRLTEMREAAIGMQWLTPSWRAARQAVERVAINRVAAKEAPSAITGGECGPRLDGKQS